MRYAKLSCTEFILVIYSNATQLTYSLIGLLAMARRVIWIRSVRPFVQRFLWNWLFSFFSGTQHGLRGPCGVVYDRGFFECIGKFSFFFLVLYFCTSVIYIVCIPSLFCGEGEEGLSLQPNFQKKKGGGEVFARTLTFTMGWGGDFSQGGYNCHIKIQLKSEIFNLKKSL